MGLLFTLMIFNEMITRNVWIALGLCLLIPLISLGIKAVSLTLLNEKELPEYVLGTAIGVISFSGYSPDAYFYPVAGKIILCSGTDAYRILFVLGLAASMVGVLQNMVLDRKIIAVSLIRIAAYAGNEL